MILRRPRPLPPGGTIGIISPASSPNPAKLDAGIAALEARGFRVRVAPHARDRRGHMAGRDEDRAADLTAFYADPGIDVLWCAGGGSSSCRLWHLLDWERLAALPPKMLIGYSDITSLHIPFQQKIGTVSLHGPMVFNAAVIAPELLEWELRLLQETGPAGVVPGRAPETLVAGIAEGPLCGGCLSLMVATLGTPYQIEAEGKLLLIEDVHEAPHRMERYLIQLREAGVLEQAAGFVIGEATGADETGALPMRQVWAELLEPFGKPTVLGLPFGHGTVNYALPLGVSARLDAAGGTVTLLDPAVAR